MRPGASIVVGGFASIIRCFQKRFELPELTPIFMIILGILTVLLDPQAAAAGICLSISYGIQLVSMLIGSNLAPEILEWFPFAEELFFHLMWIIVATVR